MKTVDLFSGCGGLSLGFMNAGYDVVKAYDNWEEVIKVYRENFDHPVEKLDLSTEIAIEKIKQDNPDVIIGGPPCQDFSSAGKREERERANLTLSFSKIVSEIQPDIFVMENVARIDKSDALQETLEILKDTPYDLVSKILDASYCGVPQLRKRFFLIGIRDIDPWSSSVLESYLEKNQSEEPLTVKEYMGEHLDIDVYYRHPRNYDRRGIYSIEEPSPTIRGVNRPLPPGFKGHPADSAPVSDDIRALTSKERGMIQTFPENFKWLGNKTNREQMIGNAVPVKLAEFVGKTVKEFIEDQGIRIDENKKETAKSV